MRFRVECPHTSARLFHCGRTYSIAEDWETVADKPAPHQESHSTTHAHTTKDLSDTFNTFMLITHLMEDIKAG